MLQYAREHNEDALATAAVEGISGPLKYHIFDYGSRDQIQLGPRRATILPCQALLFYYSLSIVELVPVRSRSIWFF